MKVRRCSINFFNFLVLNETHGVICHKRRQTVTE